MLPGQAVALSSCGNNHTG